jgi:lipid-binding SYLF domain-containing protein
MKTRIVGIVLLGLATAAFAIEPAELDNRIRALTEKFDAFQQRPDKCVPADILRKAKGIMLLDRTKAGFLFAYQGGGGVAMVRNGERDKWSPAAFVAANGASLGLQVGGEQNFYIVLFMTTNSTRMLVDPKFAFGGEARGTAGASTSGVETTSPDAPSVLVYDDRQGLYAGAAIKGGAVTPDDEADHVYYGQYLSTGDILFGHSVQPTEASLNLAGKIHAYSQDAQGGSKTAER